MERNTMKNINWLGLWTLYCKEVRRFLKVYHQTLLAPMVNAMLLLAIFSLAMGGRLATVNGLDFHQFMIPGLIMMTVVQNAFANTSSSLIMGKVMGTIIDFLIPPISPGEMAFAMTAAGVTRGILSGLMVAVAASLFFHISVYSLPLVLFYAVAASSMLALIGILAGIVSDTFDQMSAITSYVITPLAFLSGTFYSVSNLPPLWQHINRFNPFFYMIDGFRYSLTGISDAPVTAGIIVLLLINGALAVFVHRLLTRGYRLKS